MTCKPGLSRKPEITPEKLGYAPTTFRDWIAQHRAIFSAQKDRQSV